MLKTMLAGFVALLCGSALAADLPLRTSNTAFAPVAAPTPLWSGFYAGAQIGYGFGDTNYRGSAVAPGVGTFVTSPFSVDNDGLIGGLHVGYNQQYNQFVLGVEADADFARIRGETRVNAPTLVLPALGLVGPAAVDGYLFFRTEINWTASLRARVGVLFTPNLLGYVTGGVALGGIENAAARFFTAPPTVWGDSNSETRLGWTVGAGMEWAFARNWSIRAEYRYYHFGVNKFTRTNAPLSLLAQFIGVPPDATINHRFSTTLHTLRAGVSYRF